MAQGATRTAPPSGVAPGGEPITAVLARVGPVDLEGLTLAGCEAWLNDAVRVAGWLAATRTRVEELHQLLWWQAQFGPDDDDPAGDGAVDADERFGTGGGAHAGAERAAGVGPGEGAAGEAAAGVRPTARVRGVAGAGQGDGRSRARARRGAQPAGGARARRGDRGRGARAHGGGVRRRGCGCGTPRSISASVAISPLACTRSGRCGCSTAPVIWASCAARCRRRCSTR